MNKRSHYIILWVASALFVVSLFSPAIVTDFGAWQNPDGKPIPGHFCAQVYWPFYASNISILLAPLIFWLIQRFTTKPRYQRALAILLCYQEWARYACSRLFTLCTSDIFYGWLPSLLRQLAPGTFQSPMHLASWTL